MSGCVFNPNDLHLILYIEYRDDNGYDVVDFITMNSSLFKGNPVNPLGILHGKVEAYSMLKQRCVSYEVNRIVCYCVHYHPSMGYGFDIHIERNMGAIRRMKNGPNFAEEYGEIMTRQSRVKYNVSKFCEYVNVDPNDIDYDLHKLNAMIDDLKLVWEEKILDHKDKAMSLLDNEIRDTDNSQLRADIEHILDQVEAITPESLKDNMKGVETINQLVTFWPTLLLPAPYMVNKMAAYLK